MKYLAIAALFTLSAVTAQSAPTSASLRDGSCTQLMAYLANPAALDASARVYFDGLLDGAIVEGLSRPVVVREFKVICAAAPDRSVAQAIKDAQVRARDIKGG